MLLTAGQGAFSRLAINGRTWEELHRTETQNANSQLKKKCSKCTAHYTANPTTGKFPTYCKESLCKGKKVEFVSSSIVLHCLSTQARNFNIYVQVLLQSKQEAEKNHQRDILRKIKLSQEALLLFGIEVVATQKSTRIKRKGVGISTLYSWCPKTISSSKSNSKFISLEVLPVNPGSEEGAKKALECLQTKHLGSSKWGVCVGDVGEVSFHNFNIFDAFLMMP
jgi:hypothetical protein